MEKKNDKKGFTLVEIIVYIALFGIIVSVILNVILFIFGMNKKITSYSQVNSDALSAMERIVYEVTNSEYIYAPTSSASQLSLATSSYATANDDITFLDFYVESGTLFLKQDGSGSVPLTSSNVSVSALNYSYYKNGSKDSVTINLTLQSIANPDSSINLINTVTLR